MIIVSILRRDDNTITGFEISGHAGYAKKGNDIVCAGVSTVTVGTVNSIEELTGIVMNSRMKDGFLDASLPPQIDSGVSDQVQLLLASMIVMLRSIEESYGKYIQIQDVII